MQITVKFDGETLGLIEAFVRRMRRSNPGANRSDAVRTLVVRGLNAEFADMQSDDDREEGKEPMRVDETPGPRKATGKRKRR
jgi:hypothetical protein